MRQMCGIRCSKHHPTFRMRSLEMLTVKGRTATTSLAFEIKHNIHRIVLTSDGNRPLSSANAFGSSRDFSDGSDLSRAIP